MQQYPTWCSNGPNMLDTTMLDDVGPTCCIRLNRPLANEINTAFLAPMSRYAPLSSEPRQHSIQSAQSDTVITATSNAVFQKLLKLNPKKAHGPDGIPSWLLKENADLLAGPIADILNSSYQECTLPPVWKKADVVPIPKEKPIQDINRQLRPISLTSILSKLAEEFVVMTYVKPAVMEMIDSKQFGTVPDICSYKHATYLEQEYGW